MLRETTTVLTVKERTSDPIFVLADDGLNVFASLEVLGGWMEGIDVENGEWLSRRLHGERPAG